MRLLSREDTSMIHFVVVRDTDFKTSFHPSMYVTEVANDSNVKRFFLKVN